MKKIIAMLLVICMLGISVFSNIAGTGNVKADSGQTETGLKNITFSDFIPSGSSEVMQDGEIKEWTRAFASDSSFTWEDVMFTGNFKFQGSATRYLLLGNGWNGLRFDFAVDQISIYYEGGEGGSWTINAEDAKIDAFQDVPFKLSVSLKKVNEVDAQLQIYIEDQLVNLGEETSQVLANAYSEEGNLNATYSYFELSDATEECPISIASYVEGTTITFKNFSMASGKVTQTTTNSGVGITLEDVVFSGNMKFHGSKTRYLLLGNGWNGLRFDFYSHDQIGILADGVGGERWFFDPADVGMTTFQNTEFKLSISLEKVFSEDARLKVYINDKIAPLGEKNSQILKGAYAAEIGNLNNVALTLSDADESCPIAISSVNQPNFTGFGLDEFGFAPTTTIYQGTEDVVTKQLGTWSTLDNVAIEAIYNFSPAGNQVYYGGSWQGFYIMPDGDNLSLNWADLNREETDIYHSVTTITPDDVDGLSLTGRPIKMRVSFAFSNLDTSTGKERAHCTVGIKINNSYERYFQIEDTLTEIFANNILIYAADGCPISFKSVDVAEEEEFKVLTLSDFGITDSEAESGKEIYLSQNQATLHKAEIEGVYNFSSSGNKVYFGGEQTGFFLAPAQENGEECLQVGLTESEDVLIGSITKSEAGKSLVGRDLNIKAQFLLSNVTDTTADVQMNVIVDDRFYREFSKEGVLLSNLNRIVSTIADSKDTPLTVKSPNWDQKPEQTLLEVTPADFGVLDDEYTYTGDLAITGHLASIYTQTPITLNGKVFSANICFEQDMSEIRIGGGGRLPEDASAWNGIALRKYEDSFLLYDCSGMGLPNKSLELAVAGLESTSKTFNLKISFEYIDRDKDGVCDDLKCGIWFNDRLYNNEYIYSLNNIDYMGAQMAIYPMADGAKVSITSEKRAISHSFVPYILEDYGIHKQAYDKTTLGTVDHALGTIEDMTMNGSTVTGTISLSGIADVRLYGQNDNPWIGYRLSAETGAVKLSHSDGYYGTIVDTDVKAGEKFQFTIAQDFVDADEDGDSDDVRMGFWVNGELYQNRYFYFVDYEGYVGNGIVIYPHDQDQTGNVTVFDSLEPELYNVVNTVDTENSTNQEYGYLIAGKGVITVNGETVSSGSVLTKPGDYIVRCISAGDGCYIRRAVLYCSGDAHADGAIDIRDLVATKKVVLGKEVLTKAGMEGADVDRNDIVNDVDFGSVQNHLIGLKEITPVRDSYLSYKEDVMPIGGYYGPYQSTVITDIRGLKTYDCLNDDIYASLQDIGINVINHTVHDYLTNKEEVIKNLQLAEKYGIGMYVSDGRFNETRDDELLAYFLADYAHYDSLKGVFQVDEPMTSYYGWKYYEEGTNAKLESSAKRATMLNNYSNLSAFINLNPLSSTTGMVKDTAAYSTLYRQYIDDYVATCDAKYLSFDFYVFDEFTKQQEYATETRYFENLAIMREKSLQYNIPYWTYVQAGAWWNSHGTEMAQIKEEKLWPTSAQMMWNINTALAYGTKGIQYFPIVQPYYFAYQAGGGYQSRNGLIDVFGNVTRWGEAAKVANEWIAVVDDVLMNARSKEVLAMGYTARNKTGIKKAADDAGILKDTNDILSILSQKNAIIGVFEYQDKTAFYVVNYDYSNAQKITLNFNEKEQYTVISRTSKKEVNDSDACAMQLGAGEAALVIVE